MPSTPYNIPKSRTQYKTHIPGSYIKYLEKKISIHYDAALPHVFATYKRDFGNDFPLKTINEDGDKFYFRTPDGRAGWYTDWNPYYDFAAHQRKLVVFHGDDFMTIPVSGENISGVPLDVYPNGKMALYGDVKLAVLQFSANGEYPVGVLSSELVANLDGSNESPPWRITGAHFYNGEPAWLKVTENPSDVIQTYVGLDLIYGPLKSITRRTGAGIEIERGTASGYTALISSGTYEFEQILIGGIQKTGCFQIGSFGLNFIHTGACSAADLTDLSKFTGEYVDHGANGANEYTENDYRFNDGYSSSWVEPGGTRPQGVTDRLAAIQGFTPQLDNWQFGCFSVVNRQWFSIQGVSLTVVATITPHGVIEYAQGPLNFADPAFPVNLQADKQYSYNPLTGEVKQQTIKGYGRFFTEYENV